MVCSCVRVWCQLDPQSTEERIVTFSLCPLSAGELTVFVEYFSPGLQRSAVVVIDAQN
jgi:hypothetical protein